MAAMRAEKVMHAHLTACGYHLNGELFNSSCMKVFLALASTLTEDTVHVLETRSQIAGKRRAEERRAEKATKRQRFMDERAAYLLAIRQAIADVIESKYFTEGGACVNAGAFRQHISKYMHTRVSQSDLREAMAEKGLHSSNRPTDGHMARSFHGIQKK